MTFARSYTAYRTSVGQDERDPSMIPFTAWGKFDSEEEYTAKVLFQEEMRVNHAENARRLLNV